MTYDPRKAYSQALHDLSRERIQNRPHLPLRKQRSEDIVTLLLEMKNNILFVGYHETVHENR
jgi:hypothetical protein